ncbi:MAG TPA: JAB domain-containing protein [Bacteroidales bacterium]|nr:JAB domain-containing protein [Bacteroidales bacterium]
MILCHNHPSGNIKPSEADIKLTRKLKDAGTLMDISVLDHIIIGDNTYFSFADEGLM